MTTEPRVCVYTVMIGNYEMLNEQPMAHRSDMPFICLTDDPSLQSETWKVVQVTPAFKMDPIRSQRLLKICPHLIDALAGFDRSLYIDNSVVLTEPPESIIESYGWGQGIGLPTHSFRESVMDEFIEVARAAATTTRAGSSSSSTTTSPTASRRSANAPTGRPSCCATTAARPLRAAMLRWVEMVPRRIEARPALARCGAADARRAAAPGR